MVAVAVDREAEAVVEAVAALTAIAGRAHVANSEATRSKGAGPCSSC